MASHPPKPGAPPLDAPPPYPGPPPGYDPTHPIPPPAAYPAPVPPIAHDQWVQGCPGGFPPGSYPPPGQPYPFTGSYPPSSGATTVVMTQPVTVVTMPSLGPYPVQMTCPHCEAQIMTATNTSAGLLTFLLCGVLIFFGCWFLCCLVPFCVPECQDIEHHCPNCKAHLGTYRRL